MPHPERVFRTVQNSWHPANWGEDSGWMRMFRNARVWVARPAALGVKVRPRLRRRQSPPAARPMLVIFGSDSSAKKRRTIIACCSLPLRT